MALGNPAALVAVKAAKGVGTALKNKKVQLVLAVLLGLFLLKGGVSKIKRYFKNKKFNKKSTEDPNRVALQFRNAANPSGANWMIDFDGTNEEEFDKLARRIKNQDIIKEVSDAYQLKYDETLQERAAKELDADELRSFEDIIT
jgi:hypothetical protein